MTLTKADLADLLFEQVGLNKREAKDMVEAFFEELRVALESGDSVKLSGFGNFELRKKSERPGRNPKTGESAIIAERHSIRAVTTASNPDADKFGKIAFVDSLVELGYTIKASHVLVNTFYKFIRNVTDSSKRIEIRGLGTFSSTEYPAGRIKRNPSTGEKVITGKTTVIHFKCSDALRKSMDNTYL